MEYAEYGMYVSRAAASDDIGRVTGLDMVNEMVRVQFDQGSEWLPLASLVPFPPQQALDAKISRIREVSDVER